MVLVLCSVVSGLLGDSGVNGLFTLTRSYNKRTVLCFHSKKASVLYKILGNWESKFVNDN